MTSKKAFIDSSGFFALLVKNDHYHNTAKTFLETVKAGRISLHTSDYVLDETYTLLKARKVQSQIKTLSNLVEHSKVLKVHWIDSDLFAATEHYFLKHKDKDYSFTDCLSFIIMKNSSINLALTKDKHFIQAGFEVVE